MPVPTNVAVVTGDVTMDWGVGVVTAAAGGRWDPGARSRLSWQPGGAALLAELVESIANEPEHETWDVRTTGVPRRQETSGQAGRPSPLDDRFHHSFARWAPYATPDPAQVWVPEGTPARVWRIAEFLGTHRADDGDHDWATVRDDDPDAAVVVLVDADLGFRNHRNRWPKALGGGRQPFVVLRLTYARATGPLWKSLSRHRHRLVVVTSARDLRNAGARISRQISWERTAEDTLEELFRGERFRTLRDCAHVVVSYGTAGALVVSKDGTGSTARLMFDPRNLEGEWSKPYPGIVLGGSTCLTAAVATAAMRASQSSAVDPGLTANDLCAAVRRGVAAMRCLRVHGYGSGSEADAGSFPMAPIVRVLRNGDVPPLATFSMDADVVEALAGKSGVHEGEARDWTILSRFGSPVTLAERIVREGFDSAVCAGGTPGCEGFPVGAFGKLVTLDRGEIESLRTVRTLIEDYAGHRGVRPLCLGVFGPPGAGKSFGIVEVATSAVEHLKTIEFNLSQFEHPAALHDALQQVRDIGLAKERLPLVIWDEFDTTLEGEPFGWLRYFLAPMQDGRFQQGEITHPIGPAIFAFSGGTSKSLVGFGAELSVGRRKAAKVPDFLSRLQGYLDVLGPNPRREAPRVFGGAEHPILERIGGQRPADDDRSYVVRRAVLLRALLEKHWPDLVKNGESFIEDSVLRAFLFTERYAHGTRSMESIIRTSRLAGETKYLQSSLPQPDQLVLHVGPDFHRLAGE